MKLAPRILIVDDAQQQRDRLGLHGVNEFTEAKKRRTRTDDLRTYLAINLTVVGAQQPQTSARNCVK